MPPSVRVCARVPMRHRQRLRLRSHHRSQRGDGMPVIGDNAVVLSDDDNNRITLIQALLKQCESTEVCQLSIPDPEAKKIPVFLIALVLIRIAAGTCAAAVRRRRGAAHGGNESGVLHP